MIDWSVLYKWFYFGWVLFSILMLYIKSDTSTHTAEKPSNYSLKNLENQLNFVCPKNVNEPFLAHKIRGSWHYVLSRYNKSPNQSFSVNSKILIPSFFFFTIFHSNERYQTLSQIYRFVEILVNNILTELQKSSVLPYHNAFTHTNKYYSIILCQLIINTIKLRVQLYFTNISILVKHL